MPLTVGSVVEGVVSGITRFGAFVELPDGRTGLVHISEIADAYVRDVRDYVKEKDKVLVKVLSDQNGKIGLSIRQAMRRGPRGDRRSHLSFEDKLARFMKDSEDRLADLRRNTESKRGGGGGPPRGRGAPRGGAGGVGAGVADSRASERPA
ncbi:MAG: S1 RNA-binding domain-containing protein, partial [Acetobacteraceae bacterium]|nr:S1 RNA-binding domain-containing protein [Acetobacteraceae bacterium]